MTVFVIGLASIVAIFALTALRGAPYVPSKRRDIKKAFNKLYVLGEKDTLLDIGSGDGVVLRAAARRGATAIGYEINPLLVWLSRWLSRNDPRVTVKLADFWLSSFPPSTTIVYTFGESRDIAKMYKKVQREVNKLDRSLWFMSLGFKVPKQAVFKSVGAHHLYKVTPLQNREA